MLTFEFSWPPAALSPNVSVHWRTLSRAKREYKHDCYWIIMAHPQRLRLKPPVKAHVTFVNDRRRRDTDNHTAMLKPCFDALVMAILEDDSHDKLTVTTQWEVKEKGAEPVVRVSLEEAKP